MWSRSPPRLLLPVRYATWAPVGDMATSVERRAICNGIASSGEIAKLIWRGGSGRVTAHTARPAATARMIPATHGSASRQVRRWATVAVDAC